MPKKIVNDIAHHIFSVSATMTGVCLTVITLFKVMNAGAATLVDEILAINAFIFIVSCFVSYLSLRDNNNKRMELIADAVFFIGMLIMATAGLLIVYVVY
jgi:uncharacterized membrane protein SirB2